MSWSSMSFAEGEIVFNMPDPSPVAPCYGLDRETITRYCVCGHVTVMPIITPLDEWTHLTIEASSCLECGAPLPGWEMDVRRSASATYVR